MMCVFNLVRSALPLLHQRNLRSCLARRYVANAQEPLGMSAVWEVNDQRAITQEHDLENVTPNGRGDRLENDRTGLNSIYSHSMRQRATLKPGHGGDEYHHDRRSFNRRPAFELSLSW